LARALLANPRLLVLDEATSALDGRTEAAIQATLRKVRAGRTTLTIAHRLSTIADADEILVVRRGRIVERGDHAELIAHGGEYAALWRRQTREEPARSPRAPRTAEPEPVLISSVDDEPDPEPETEA
jgi:ATP-binding cassette subfamily B protein